MVILDDKDMKAYLVGVLIGVANTIVHDLLSMSVMVYTSRIHTVHSLGS